MDPMLRITRRAALGAALPLLAAPAVVAQTGRLQPVKFRLDWVWQAPQSVWTLAAERGFFREEGLDVTIDRGFGGPDTFANVASGGYDFGFSDINGLVEYNAKNPTARLMVPFVVYDATLAAIITRKGNGINTPKDLEGKTLGAPLTTGGRTLFPAFARVNGIDLSKITWQTIAIQLQDQQFAQGNFDAIAGFATTSLLNLKQLGVDRSRLTVFNFFNHGLDLYGTSIVARPETMQARPDFTRAFLRGTMRGIRAMLADKRAAIASLQKRDPLLDMAIELERLDLMIEMALRTPDIAAHGVSHVKPERLARGLEIVAEAFNVAPVPKPEDIFTDAYLPAETERRIPVA